MRYEVAAELKDRLNKSTLGLVDLGYMAGVVPSYTKLGMAVLLPHKSLQYRGKDVLVDGMSSWGLENRGKILQKICMDSIVVNSDEIIKNHREEARELIKGKRVVYVYHDKIDSTGDKRALENDVFKAAQETIEELEELIKKLTISLNATNIIVTADHGLIYRRDDMENVDKLDVSSFDNLYKI